MPEYRSLAMVSTGDITAVTEHINIDIMITLCDALGIAPLARALNLSKTDIGILEMHAAIKRLNEDYNALIERNVKLAMQIIDQDIGTPELGKRLLFLFLTRAWYSPYTMAKAVFGKATTNPPCYRCHIHLVARLRDNTEILDLHCNGCNGVPKIVPPSKKLRDETRIQRWPFIERPDDYIQDDQELKELEEEVKNHF